MEPLATSKVFLFGINSAALTAASPARRCHTVAARAIDRDVILEVQFYVRIAPLEDQETAAQAGAASPPGLFESRRVRSFRRLPGCREEVLKSNRAVTGGNVPNTAALARNSKTAAVGAARMTIVDDLAVLYGHQACN